MVDDMYTIEEINEGGVCCYNRELPASDESGLSYNRR